MTGPAARDGAGSTVSYRPGCGAALPKGRAIFENFVREINKLQAERQLEQERAAWAALAIQPRRVESTAFPTCWMKSSVSSALERRL
jgi:hypothetical protein